MKTAQIVIGLGFGDEGKGMTTAYLASQKPNSIVARFSGGHQAGHTVIKDGKRHVFSSFGAGTLHGVPTFWSEYCTLYPFGWCNEYDALLDMGLNLDVYIDNKAMVTTYFDVFFNRALEDVRQGNDKHGSCGVGIGTTMQRNEESPCRFYAHDLTSPFVIKQRLAAIREYYWNKCQSMAHTEFGKKVLESYDNRDFDKAEALFYQNAAKLSRSVTFTTFADIAHQKDNIVFEGSQGVLLDRDHGFFPNVTRSHTTSRNAMAMCESVGIDRKDISIYYITRCYQTRHGNGPMTDDTFSDRTFNPNETNVLNQYQGEFRKGRLDADLLSYSLRCDLNYIKPFMDKHLVVTCTDQMPDGIEMILNGKVTKITRYDDLRNILEGWVNDRYNFRNILIGKHEEIDKFVE